MLQGMANECFPEDDDQDVGSSGETMIYNHTHYTMRLENIQFDVCCNALPR